MEEKAKATAKKVFTGFAKVMLPIILIVIGIICFLAAITYWITVDDGTYKEDDWESTPYAASTYTSGVNVSSEGTIQGSTTVQELWDEMEKNGSRVDKYLSSPKELARLMKAEIVTQYPDTRPKGELNKQIDWQDIVENEDKLQGIIKFKRADADGNEPKAMSYVDPETFQGYIDEYNGTGSENAKKKALTHFTLKKSAVSTSRRSSSSSSSSSSRGNAVNESKIYFIGDSWIEGFNSTGAGVAKTSYIYGNVGKHAGSPEMAITSIPEKNDASAIILYLGVNDPSTYDKMNSLIDELANKYIGKPIYVVEVSPVNPDKYKGAVTNNQIHNYNQRVKEHCNETENVQFLEVASSVTDTSGKLDYTNDGLHLNSKSAYQTWYDSIMSAIRGNNSSSEETSSNGNSNATETSVEGDGYHKEYTSSAGITYRCYKQYEGSYSGNRYWSSNPNGTISSSGCGPTSVAILCSGLVDTSITPAETAQSMYDRHRIY